MTAQLGRRPMQNVAPDMIRIDQLRAHRRPRRSPSVPQMIPPIGRRMNDNAKTVNVDSNAAVLSAVGKKTTAMVVARYA